MRAIILAAGASKRLHPLTADLPKCLLPIAGKTILEHQLHALAAADIREIVIVTGFRSDLIEKAITSAPRSLSIRTLSNPRYATTGPILGGLGLVSEYLAEKVIFFHCDVLFELSALIELLQSPHETTMLYRAGVWDEEAGKIRVDKESDRVLELGKHIAADAASGEYLQIAKFGSDFLARLRTVVAQRQTSGEDGYSIDAFNDVIRDGSIAAFGVRFDGNTAEIDTPEDYAAAKAGWERV